LNENFGEVDKQLRDWLELFSTGMIGADASDDVKLVKQYYDNLHLTGAEMKMAKTKWQLEMDEHARIAGALQEGVAKTKMDNAARMIADGVSDEKIAQYTTLSILEVSQLRCQLSADALDI
jgi:hypothetical protein